MRVFKSDKPPRQLELNKKSALFRTSLKDGLPEAMTNEIRRAGWDILHIKNRATEIEVVLGSYDGSREEYHTCELHVVKDKTSSHATRILVTPTTAFNWETYAWPVIVKI